MKALRLVASAVLFVSSLSARDFRPASHLEKIPLADSSILECYVLETAPGVAYTVEVSNNLSNWTPQDEIYGLGGEYVVTMREFTPPPPPPPGTPAANPPPLAANVSLRIQPASGPAGGSVVAWPSLDHAGPVIVRIAGEMDSAWNSIPIFWNRFGTYNFYFWHPGTPIAPPLENPPLGPKDTAMLAALEAAVPDINQQIAASILHARNAPPPAPPDPDSKRFWRVKVDWSLDTDQDGSPDWAEFEIAARGTGMLVPGVVGDAFNADTNNDGIPDGKQLDADGDGTPDVDDPDPDDNTATFPIGPVPRYALFPITNAQPEPGLPQPIQISNKGTVLYQNGTWTAGLWTSLNATSGTEINGTKARAINDNNQIIGVASHTMTTGSPSISDLLHGVCYWAAPDAGRVFVSSGSIGSEKYAVPSWELFDNQLSPGPVLSNDGHFSASTLTNANLYAENPQPGYWQLPTGGQPASEISGDHRLEYGRDPSFRWGAGHSIETYALSRLNPFGVPEDSNTPLERLIHAPNALLTPPIAPMNVIVQPGGSILAMPSAQSDDKAQVFIDGKWQESKRYAHAIDMSADGTAIGKAHDNLTAPICLNGKWNDISRTAPGLSALWRDETVKFLDTTPGGWILAQRGSGTEANPQQSAIMLPIKVAGVDPDSVAPPIDPPEFLAGGVDSISMTAIGGTGRVPEIWIMAPNGGAANTVRFRSPVNENSKLTLAPQGDQAQSNNPDISFSPNILDVNDIQVQVSGKKTDSADITPDLKLGGTLKSLSSPIKVKTMKKRTVKVAVHQVIGLDSSSTPTVPDLPSEGDMEDALNKVFGLQTNTFFDITSYVNIDPALGGIDFDLNNDLTLDTSSDVAERTAATPHAKAGGEHPTANIDVWVISGVSLKSAGEVVAGVHYGGAGVGKILINADMGDGSLSGVLWEEYFLHVLSHEIGHVLIGAGHPNEGVGPCVLKWTHSGPAVSRDPRDQARLMCSGTAADLNNLGKQLIKEEWDRIEAWLRSEEERLGRSL